jgi:hypothetical protein
VKLKEYSIICYNIMMKCLPSPCADKEKRLIKILEFVRIACPQ